jgi:hypothetical protein
MQRFGREQKEILIRQPFHISQVGSLVDYVEKFAGLVDQFTAYGHVSAPVYYAMHFVDGLRDDIRGAIVLHHPIDFDTAASLALLQEDTTSHSKSSRRGDFFYGSKPSSKGPHPLLPPPRVDKQLVPQSCEEKRLCEGKTPEEKLAALHNFCKSKGLCVRCAEMWHKDHKFGSSIQLHVVQKLLELFNMEDIEQMEATCEQPDQLYVVVSQEAISGQDGPRTMRLMGVI